MLGQTQVKVVRETIIWQAKIIQFTSACIGGVALHGDITADFQGFLINKLWNYYLLLQ